MTKEDEFGESSKTMFDSIGKLLKRNWRLLEYNPILPVTINDEDASIIRKFIERGYTNDVGGPNPERQRLWDEALKIQEQVLLFQEEKPDMPVTISIEETQLEGLQTLASISDKFGFSPDEKVDTVLAIMRARDSFDTVFDQLPTQ